MKLAQGVLMAWGSVRAHPLRTLLTVLGVLIGVASVTVLVAIGQGSTRQIEKQLESLGTNLVAVNIIGRGARDSLSPEQIDRLMDMEGIAAYAPVISGGVTVKAGNRSATVPLEATTADYAWIRNYEVEQGRFLLDIDNALAQKVAVIGPEVAGELGLSDPVGATVTIQGVPFRVVGVLEAKGATIGGSNDNRVFVPLQSARIVLRTAAIRTVYARVSEPELVEGVVNLLRLRLAGLFGGPDGFNVFNQQEIMQTFGNITGTLTAMLAGIAGISLVVGGIGIMNIMLVSVTERTREIGIRKSLGAKRRDILFQFLVEASMIGGIGGLCGIAAGLGGAWVFSRAMNIPAIPSPGVILMAFAFSLGVGLVFGIMPARRAARLDPVEALRQP